METNVYYEVKINGKTYVTNQNKKLMRVLRDDLHLKSVKDGCSQGACGTCTVIIDGKAMKACIPTMEKCNGKEVITVEGMSDREKEAFVYAFGECGAVQCGFCIPGMVMSGKALIDQNPTPSEDDIKKAIRGNICRCTGYRKIIEGIQMAAEILRGDREVSQQDDSNLKVGERYHRIDVREKVLGTGVYVDDMEIDGMVYASAVRSKYPRARIVKIDTSKAEKVDGVIGILTAQDVPHNKVGHIQQDWDVMIEEGNINRYVGDAIVTVVANTEEILEKAKKLVEIEYEPLEPVRSIEEALKADAPKVHSSGNMCQRRHVVRGNAKEALANSKYVVSDHFSTPFTEHAFLEPEAAIAFPYKDGVKVYTSDQGTYDTRKEIAIMFGWDADRIVVENKLIGGAFGGKEDVSIQHLACLCAYKFDRTVKMKLTRDESLAFHPKRHAMEADFTVGCDENGIIQAIDCDIYFDTGAYASLCGPVLERACTHAVGPYTYQNTDIRGYGLYTNNPPAGAFRGFGVCQSNFAFESLLNVLAEKVGISPWEIRYRNAIEPGKVLPNGQIADVSTALKETLEAVKEEYDKNRGRVGIACAMKNSGVGVGLPDKGRARLVIEDNLVRVYTAASDLGQGFMSVAHQMVCDDLNLNGSQVVIMPPNTETSPDSGTSSGSRQTLLTGEALQMACADILKTCESKKCKIFDLAGKEFLSEYFEPTDPLGSPKKNPKSHIAYGYATHMVILDEDGKVEKVIAAHDSGKVVNPTSIQGQIEGGVLMGMGYALTEDFKLEDCFVKSKFGTLGLFRAPDIPDIEAVYIEKNELLPMAFGAKGIGEIATIPIASACAGAYYELDQDLRTKFPMRDTFYSKPKKKFK
ncbi:MAG: selenium-dependent xanthine dehydrogenase [Tissierellia bacterium]|nr:selenium-dependent xanthine dehydrogenase [Tissierellia bacterium]